MGYPFGNYETFLAVAIATHAAVGYTLGRVLFGAPRAGLIGGVLADVDLLFPVAWGPPLVHRGITHTLLAAGLAVGLAASWSRATAGAVGVGYTSQLLIDATTPKGVPVGYPIVSDPVYVPLRGHSTIGTVLLWSGCLVVLWRYRGSSARS